MTLTLTVSFTFTNSYIICWALATLWNRAFVLTSYTSLGSNEGKGAGTIVEVGTKKRKSCDHAEDQDAWREEIVAGRREACWNNEGSTKASLRLNCYTRRVYNVVFQCTVPTSMLGWVHLWRYTKGNTMFVDACAGGALSPKYCLDYSSARFAVHPFCMPWTRESWLRCSSVVVAHLRHNARWKIGNEPRGRWSFGMT